MTTTARWGWSLLIRRTSSTPSIPGRRLSVSTRSTSSFLRSSTASSPLPTTSTSYPSTSRVRWSGRRKISSSSTIRTRWCIAAPPLDHFRDGRQRRPWDDQADRGPPPGRAVDLDLAAVEVHDLLDDRHAEPRARRLRRVEGQEDLLPVLGLDADAVVRDLDHHGRGARLEVHVHPPAQLTLGRLERVLHDVGEHLPEAWAVDRLVDVVVEPALRPPPPPL